MRTPVLSSVVWEIRRTHEIEWRNSTHGKGNWWRDAYVQNDVAVTGVESTVLRFLNRDQTAPRNAPNVQPSGIRSTIFTAQGVKNEWEEHGQVQSNISITTRFIFYTTIYKQPYISSLLSTVLIKKQPYFLTERGNHVQGSTVNLLVHYWLVPYWFLSESEHLNKGKGAQIKTATECAGHIQMRTKSGFLSDDTTEQDSKKLTGQKRKL